MENLKNFLETQVENAVGHYYFLVADEEENELLIDNAWNELCRTLEDIGGTAWWRGATEAQMVQATQELFGENGFQTIYLIDGWNEAEYGH